MIKTTAIGFYDISLDNGKTFPYKTENLILNNYYNKTSFSINLYLVIGSGSSEPQLTDNSLDAQFGQSGQEQNFDTLSETEIFNDRFEIKYSRLFDFGTGYTNTITELGILNPNLCSRALLKDPTGAQTSAPLVSTDHVVIRYSITYIVPRASNIFNLTINNQAVVATVTAVNGSRGAWGSTTLADIINYDSVGVADAGTWSIDENGDIVGSNITNGISLITAINNDSGLTVIGTAVTTQSEWIGTFQQLLFTSSGVNYINSTVLIDLDVPVTKTATSITTISINVNQSA